MWREYFGFAATAFAVINGLIAIAVALLPVRRSVLKLRLGAAALVLGALAVGATFYSTYRATIRSSGSSPTAPRSASGFEIRAGRPRVCWPDQGCRRELPTTAADEWALRAEIYLRDKLGERYVPASARKRASSTATTRGLRCRGWPTGARCETASSIWRRSARNSRNSRGCGRIEPLK